MTLSELQSRLKSAPADAPLVFSAPEGDITGGYHVTEFKRAQIAGVDCGGGVRRWSEASFQLLDGYRGEHMTVGKFASILGKSLARIEAEGGEPVMAEFAPGNGAFMMHDLGAPKTRGGRVEIRLAPRKATCKAGRTTCC